MSRHSVELSTSGIRSSIESASHVAPITDIRTLLPQLEIFPQTFNIDSDGSKLHDLLYPGHSLNNLQAQKIIRKFSTEENKGDVDEVYDANGNFLLFGEDDMLDSAGNPNYYTRPVFEMQTELMRRTAPFYRLNDRRLREDKPENGYNRHDIEGHILPTGKMIEQLCVLGKHSERIKFLAHQVNMIHDLGNLEERLGHSIKSMPLAVAIMPSITQDWKGFRVTEIATELHDEKALEARMKFLGKLDQNELIDSYQRLGEEEGLDDELPIVLAMMILADKADVDRERLNFVAINGLALADDLHVRVVALSRNAGFRLSDDKSTLIHRVEFNPNILDKEFEKLSGIAREKSNKKGSYRVDVPEVYKDIRRKQGIPDFYQFAKDYKRIYRNRIKYSALFAPIAVLGVKYFALEFHDLVDPSDSNVGETIRETFTSSLLAKHGELFDVKFMQKEKRRPEDYIQTSFSTE